MAKALCVLEYADHSAGVVSATGDKGRALVPRTLENLAAVLHPGIEAEPVTEGVRGAVERLESKGKVKKTAHGFELLTPAAQKWEDERRGLKIFSNDRIDRIRETAKEILDDISSFRHERGRKFSIEWLLDGRAVIGGARDLRIEMRRPASGQSIEEATRGAEATTRKDEDVFVWLLMQWDDIEDTAQELCLSEGMVGLYRDRAGSAFDKLVHDEKQRVTDFKREIRQKVQAAVLDGVLVFGGVSYAREAIATLSDRVKVAIQTIIDARYTEFRFFAEAPSPTALDGKRVVVQLRETDPDTGGQYTLKRWHVTRYGDDGAVEEIELRSENSDFKSIVLSSAGADTRAVAEFLELVGV